jgi:hypothetical protein
VGPHAASGLRLAGLLALPAVIATHTVTGSLARALHPAAFVGMVRGLGSGYVVVIAVAVAAWWLGRFVLLDAGQLSLLLRLALLMLLWLAMFSTLGGVMHARRATIGYEPEHSPERDAQRSARELDRERERFVDRLFAEYRAGRSESAWQSIEEWVSRSSDAIGEYGWIHARVAAWDPPRLAHRVARALLPRLLAARRNGEALALARARLAADPDFRPESGEQLVRLCELARDAGDRPLARTLLRDFDRHYPGDPAAVQARRFAGDLER